MRIPALGLKRKQWEPLAFASPSMALIAFVIVFPLAYSFYRALTTTRTSSRRSDAILPEPYGRSGLEPSS